MSVTTHASSTRQVEFCGRDGELAAITAALGQLGDGTSAVVVIEGGAGMGKSRLLAEVIGVARGLGVKVGASAADPSESVVELAALLAALSDASSPLVDRDHDRTFERGLLQQALQVSQQPEPLPGLPP